MSKLRVKNNTWLISDTHFGHDNIIKFEQRPKNHESIMLGKWIDRVRDEDTILHLGDVVMVKGVNNQLNWLRIIGCLPGKKYLILGNHDKRGGKVFDAYSQVAGFELIDEFIQNGVVFTHRPMSTTKDFLEPWAPVKVSDWWKVNIHGHTHGNVFNPEHDGTPVEGKRYVNVCVEHTNLGPVQVGNVLDRWNWKED